MSLIQFVKIFPLLANTLSHIIENYEQTIKFYLSKSAVTFIQLIRQ